MHLRPVCVFTAIFAMAAAHETVAKDLFVDGARGNDTTSYAANSAAQPWRTLGRALWGSPSRTSQVAAEAAQAGDTVIVAAGMYDTNASTGTRVNPIYNPANRGVAGRPIIIRAATPGSVELRATGSPTGQPIIGVMDRSYIVWDGFVINEQYVPTTADTGPTVVWSGDNIVMQNLTIRGYNRGWVDNHNGIRIELSTNVTIRNNSISGYRESQQAYNSSGTTMYRSTNVLIENNDYFESNAGIYLKGFNTTGIVIRNNKFRSVGNGIQLGGVQDVKIYRNIFDQCWEGGVTLSIYNDTNGVNNAAIVNNVFMRVGGADFGGVTFRGGGVFFERVLVANNIIGRGPSGMAVWASTVPAVVTSQYNAFYGNNSAVVVAWRPYTLPAWQTTFGKDQVGSLETNPLFVGESTANYRLTTDSPLRNLGMDVLDLNGNGSTTDRVNIGAYATGTEVIGMSADATPVQVPRPPQDVVAE